ncbi:MAG: CrcB family protein [Planctomycetota bacterium]
MLQTEPSASVWIQVIAVASGGAAGSTLRLLLASAISQGGREAHWGTLLVNIVGSACLGALMAWLAGEGGSTTWRALARYGLGIGVLGSFTTFSTFSHEAMTLLRTERWGLACLYMGASMVLCIVAAAGGWALAHHIWGAEPE